MGAYTTIIHPDDGRKLQIKCGFDECRTYRVGDDVGQYIFPDHPGKGYLLDDVYISHSSLNVYGEDGEDDLVIIKGGRVVAVESLEATRDEIRVKRPSFPDADWAEVYEEEPDYVSPYDCRLYLRQEWDISDPPRSLWNEEAWEEEERARFQQLVTALAGPLRRNWDYTSIGRQVFQVEPLPAGAILAYEGLSDEIVADRVAVEEEEEPPQPAPLSQQQRDAIIQDFLDNTQGRPRLDQAMSELFRFATEEEDVVPPELGIPQDEARDILDNLLDPL